MVLAPDEFSPYAGRDFPQRPLWGDSHLYTMISVEAGTITRRSKNRATALLRLAAVNVGKTDSALGAFYRRLAMRVGKAKAVTATARKVAVLFYNTMRYGVDYSDPGASYYEERHRERVLHNLSRRAKQFGYTLEPTPEAGVS